MTHNLTTTTAGRSRHKNDSKRRSRHTATLDLDSCPGHTEIASAFAIVYAFPQTGHIACVMRQCITLSVAITIELRMCNNKSP